MNQLTVDVGTTNISISLTYMYIGHGHDALLFKHMSDTRKNVCPVFRYNDLLNILWILWARWGHCWDTLHKKVKTE